MAALESEQMNNTEKAKVRASQRIALNCVQTLSGVAPVKMKRIYPFLLRAELSHFQLFAMD